MQVPFTVQKKHTKNRFSFISCQATADDSSSLRSTLFVPEMLSKCKNENIDCMLCFVLFYTLTHLP